MAGAKPTHTPKQLASFTSMKPAAQPHQVNAATQAARPIMTEAARKAAPAAQHAGSSPASHGAEKMLRAEAPIRAAVQKVQASPAIHNVTGPAKVAPMRDSIKAAVAVRTPEQPSHAHIAKGAGPSKGPVSAEHNRRLKRDESIRRATPARKVAFTGGASPADIANGLTTPGRGAVTVHTLPFPVGTPQAIREATPEAAAVALSTKPTPVMTLPPTVVVAEPKNDPNAAEPAAEGFGRIAFLGGAVFVAWLLLKGAA